MEAPWAASASERGVVEPSLGAPLLMVLAAVDTRGVFAGAAYVWTTNGIAIDELELEAPDGAMPVMRGVTRIAPGCAIPAAAPLAIEMQAGQPVAIACDPRTTRLDPRSIEQSPFRIVREPTTRLITIFEPTKSGGAA